MKPRIGYDNLFVRFRNSIDQSSGSATGRNLGNWLTGPDSSWLIPNTSEAWVRIFTPTGPLINYFAMARHNLAGVTIRLQAWSGFNWLEVATYTPPDNDAFMLNFQNFTRVQYRVFIQNPGPGRFIGVASIGRRLDLERGLFVGHSPITENENNRYLNNLSESGEFIGRKLIRQGASTSIDLENVTADWVRDHWRPFRKHAEKNPFFFQWNPSQWSDEVGLCWTTGDPSADNSGVGFVDNKGRMSLSMPMQGLVR